MYHVDDLPFDPYESLPEPYTKFRERSDKTTVRAMVPTPKDSELPRAEKTTELIT